MRLIDADALMKNWERDRGRMFDADYFIFTIEHAPTIDAVPVVRCKDCTYYGHSYEGDFCSSPWAGMDEDGYCSDWERKDDDETD